MTSIAINDLPRKALQHIFSRLDQTERERHRSVCKSWKNVIDEDFKVSIIITPSNFEKLFKCARASEVEIHNLKTEYSGNVAFGSNVRVIRFSGKVLSSNIFSILRFCPDLEKLAFSSLKQVLGIESVESVKLAKTTDLEIAVRPDQETFTSDEIIVISTLKQIIFGALETIVISTIHNTWEEEENNEDYVSSELSEELGSPLSLTPLSSVSTQMEEITITPFEENSETSDLVTEDIVVDVSEGEDQQPPDIPANEMNENEATNPQTANTNVHVIVNRAANFPNVAGSDEATSMSQVSRSSQRVRHSASEFEARLFRANLELLLMEGEDLDSNALNVFSDSLSQTQVDAAPYFDVPGTATPAIKHSVFFEFVRNNHFSLKNLQVRTRTDFMCFGNVSSFGRDVAKVQFEDVDYSFGRMQMCYEYLLLRAQSKLRKLKLQVLDDMWKHAMRAVENSSQTLTDLDIKVMSMSDDRINFAPILHCSNLKLLKLLHFFENETLSRFPTSLNKLVLNGPVKYDDMQAWTSELLELTDLTLLLNVRGDKIDLPLYKNFLKMPKMSRLTLIQCPMDLEEIKNFIEHGIPSRNGLKFWVSGPLEIREIPTIQYVQTLISPDKFNREQINIDG